MECRTHKDLHVWRAAVELASAVYQHTEGYPRRERYGLARQMRRSAVSIASNIAEGAARRTHKEFTHMLYVALASASELDTQIEISKAAEMAGKGELDKLQADVDRVSQLLQGLIRHLRCRQPRAHESRITNHDSRA